MEECKFNELGVFIECASNAVPKIDTLKKFVGLMQKMGYNSLYLGTADTYKIEGEEYFGYMRGRYTASEIKELDAFCEQRGIELVPAIQTLAHLKFLPNYHDYKDFFDNTDIMLVDDERTYILIDKMFAAMRNCFTSSRINIGMDEAFLLGSGKHLQKYGYEDRVSIMLRHLSRVIDIAKNYGFECEMWSDMFFRLGTTMDGYQGDCSACAEVRKKIPSNLKLVYWNYSSTTYSQNCAVLDKHLELSANVGYAGGLWKWIGYAPDNRFSIQIGEDALNACIDKGIKSFIVTLWGDNGGETSLFSILPSLFFYAEKAHGRAVNKDKFFNITGVRFDDFMTLDYLNNPYKKNLKTLANKNYWCLYNDLLLGTFDCIISDGLSGAYANIAIELAQINGGEYSYIFNTLATLAKVLGIKAGLGKKIKSAYDKRDFTLLERLANKDIPKLIEFYNEFFDNFVVGWNAENKSFGVEVPCVRIGGLIQRAKYVQRQICDFINNKTSAIAELDEVRLPLGYGYERGQDEDSYLDMNYQRMVTHGFI